MAVTGACRSQNAEKGDIPCLLEELWSQRDEVNYCGSAHLCVLSSLGLTYEIVTRSEQQNRATKTPDFWPRDPRKERPRKPDGTKEVTENRNSGLQPLKVVYELPGSPLICTCIDLTLSYMDLENRTTGLTIAQIFVYRLTHA